MDWRSATYKPLMFLPMWKNGLTGNRSANEVPEGVPGPAVRVFPEDCPVEKGSQGSRKFPYQYAITLTGVDWSPS